MSDYTLYYWSVPFRGQFVRAVLAWAGRRADPVAPGTTQIPAQDASVTRPLEPMLESDVDRTPALTSGVDRPRP